MDLALQSAPFLPYEPKRLLLRSSVRSFSQCRVQWVGFDPRPEYM